ncbi:MAG: DUF4440 domain-containing protein, partial [Actinomycetota bacterium]|nr:DUF4440 domain-containing protein [Actinomycetota bacterium]
MIQPISSCDAAFVSVSDWMRAWGAEVAAADLEAARRRFAPDVVAFGTHAHVVHGLDALHDEQWFKVWPAIAGFTFRLDDLAVLVSPDGRQAVAVVGWDSTGFTADGEPFDRPGRATVVMQR